VVRAEAKREVQRAAAEEFEIAALQGRNVALRLSSSYDGGAPARHFDEAIRLSDEALSVRNGNWRSDEATRARFAATLSREQASFRADGMREILDESLLETRRRVVDAIEAASVARLESERADAASNSEHFASGIRPVDHEQRMRTRTVLVNSTRAAAKLRSAVQQLEVEAQLSEAAHAADVRSVGSRLLAQRDAIASIVLTELHRAEMDGDMSLRQLLRENAKLAAEVASREEDIKRLDAQLEASKVSAYSARQTDSQRNLGLETIIDELHGRIEALTRELHEERGARAVEVVSLRAELKAAEERWASERAMRERTASGADRAARGTVERYDALVTALRAQGKADVTALRQKLSKLNREHQALVVGSEARLAQLARNKDKELSMLRSRLSKQSEQLVDLRAESSSRGRAAKYWHDMRAPSAGSRHGYDGEL
jgi:hypothetical protein